MIIDTHVHIGGDAVGFNMSEAMVTQMMNKYNIDYAIVSNGDAGEMDHHQRLLPENYQISQEDALKRTIRFARENKGRIGVAVWVKPYLQQPTEELKKLISKNRDIVCAIKLHPFHSNISPVHKRALPYLELAEEYKLAVVSHTGGCEAASAFHLYEAAMLFRNIPFVMVHMGLGTDNKEALDLLGKADNLYGDTTWVKTDITIEAIKRYGTGKMIFGSDAPIDGVDTYLCNPKGERSIYQDYFHTLKDKIGTTAYEALMYKNAMKIFDINT